MRGRRYAVEPAAAGLVALVAAMAVGLAGCTTTEPTPSPTGSSTPVLSTAVTSSTVTPTPSSTGLAVRADVPQAARFKTKAGAEAFAKFFFQQTIVAWTKPDPKAMDRLYTATCKGCASLDADSESLALKGRHYAAPPVTISSLRVPSSGTPTFVYWSGTQNRVDIVDNTGKVISTDPEQALTGRLTLVWKGGWQCEEFA